MINREDTPVVSADKRDDEKTVRCFMKNGRDAGTPRPLILRPDWDG